MQRRLSGKCSIRILKCKNLEKGSGHLLDMVLKRSDTLSKREIHKEFGKNSRKDAVGIR